MPKSKPPYPLEFRREAIELVRLSGKSINQVAEDLGISDMTLRNWIKRAEVDAGKRAGLTTEEPYELRALRRENRTLRMEREILKKAAAFFARESDGRYGARRNGFRRPSGLSKLADEIRAEHAGEPEWSIRRRIREHMNELKEKRDDLTALGPDQLVTEVAATGGSEQASPEV